MQPSAVSKFRDSNGNIVCCLLEEDKDIPPVLARPAPAALVRSKASETY